MLALALEKISLRMSLFVEGVMLKSLACHSIAGWCLLCLAVISFQIMTSIRPSRFSSTDSITACSINKQASTNLGLTSIAKGPLRLGLSPQIVSGQIGPDKHMLEASVK